MEKESGSVPPAQDLLGQEKPESISPTFGPIEPESEEVEDRRPPEPETYSDEELELKMRFKRIVTDIAFIISWFVENAVIRWARRIRNKVDEERKPDD